MFGDANSNSAWLRIPKDKRSDFIIESTPLSDGATLRVGRSSSRPENLLGPFFTAFLVVIVPTLILAIAGGAMFAYRATASRFDRCSKRPARSLALGIWVNAFR